MGLFSKHNKIKDETAAAVTPEEGVEASEDNDAADTHPAEEEARSEVGYTRETGKGPFDADTEDVPELERVDVGALLLPYVDESTIQFSVNQATNEVLGVVYIKDNSSVQLQVFAAPKSHGIWEDVRPKVITSIAHQHGRFNEVDGEFGKEVLAEMPGTQAGQRVPVRFIGIDGPRWLLRIALTGAGTYDTGLGSKLIHEVIDDLVVVRGARPHPTEELLPLHLPDATPVMSEGRPTYGRPARGPQITEVR